MSIDSKKTADNVDICKRKVVSDQESAELSEDDSLSKNQAQQVLIDVAMENKSAINILAERLPKAQIAYDVIGEFDEGWSRSCFINPVHN